MQLLSVGDVTGAYWYTLVLETTRTPTCVSSDILAVLQAARWLDADGPLLAGDIIDRVDRAVIGDSRPARLLATAAALVPALTEPSTKLLGWLERDVDPSLAGVVAAITAFANQGRSLSPWILQGAHDVGERDRTLREVGAKVARWLEDAPQRRTGYQAASKLWQVMFERLFRDALLAARDNRIDRYDAIADMCQRLRTGYDEEIDDLDRSLRQAHFSRIQEPARSWLYQMIRSTLAVLDEWLRTAELTRQLERQDWMLRLVHELRRDVEQAMSGALVGAAEMISSGDVSEAACGFCLADSLRRLCGLLSLDVRWPASLPRGATEQPPLLTALLKEQPPNNLLEGLAARLLWCPPSRFDPGTDTLSEHASGLLAVLDRPVPAVEEAFAQWVDAEAFDRAERLATFVRDALRSDMNGRRDRARLLLEQEVEALRGQVEQAVVDGYVGDERSELLSNLGGIEPQRRNDLATARDQTRAVKELLDRRLDARLARAMNDWEDLRKEAQQRGAEAALLDRWTEHLQAARRRGDVRVLDERLARLREWQARGEPIGDVPPASPSERQAFNELVAFRQASTAVLRQGWGMVQKALRGEGLPGLHLPPEPARGLAFQALEQWFDLKRLGPGGHADALIARVAWILRFVGYNAADLPVKLEFEKRGGSRWMAFRADLEDGEASPVPQFGSMPRGRYRVICVWEGAGVDLGAILAALPGTEATIFIYLGAMSDQMRSSLRLVGAQRHIALVCMDEVLIYFLAGESADRLRTFYACTLPYAHINPYTPFQAGEVPREMYFGRKAAVQKLMAPEGGCIVYGGRQLGKSALLREVCRKFHHPERDQYAVVIDVQHVGDAGAQVDTKAVWPLVRDRLRELKLVETKKTRPEDIVAALREALLERPNARLLLLLDEADKLLDADAKDGFVVIDGFRQLMAETNRRFKVVLAGLHSVQRFQQLPNQPLAHFGESIQVGPLEPRDAEDLVTKPLSALGYEFESRDDVLRILSYTNYHPGLIQIFCQDLLEQLRNAPVAQLPPLKITREQVNRVYQRPQVRRRIQERFDWTLALDLRYQAIAWSVIVEESGPQQRRGVYRTGELLAVVRSWWPKGFAATTLDEFHGLLDEMCGLGVLVGTSEVGYRLRSPNIAQLMGDVGARLLELSEREPPSVFDVDRQHRKVGHEDQFSPLTLGQERQLFAPRWAPVLVFGSTALGINTFFPSLRGLEGPRLTVARADLTAERGAIEAWLRTQELPKEGVLVIAAKAPPDAVGARGLLEEARRVCRTRSGSNMHGRVVITFDEAAATAWSQLPSRSEVEGHAESTLLLLRKWSAPALKARLISRELLATEQHLRRLLEVTGGWAMLVDAVFLQMKTDGVVQDRYEQSLEELERELATAGSSARGQFQAAVGIDVSPRAGRLLRLINDIVGVKDEAEGHLTPELFAPDLPGLSVVELANLLDLLVRLGAIDRHSEARSTSDLPTTMIRVDPVVARVALG
jgi:hypothetical protein